MNMVNHNAEWLLSMKSLFSRETFFTIMWDPHCERQAAAANESNQLTLKLELPCMLGAETSWWMTDRLRAKVARAPWRLSPTVLHTCTARTITSLHKHDPEHQDPAVSRGRRPEYIHDAVCHDAAHQDHAVNRRRRPEYIILYDIVCHDPAHQDHAVNRWRRAEMFYCYLYTYMMLSVIIQT